MKSDTSSLDLHYIVSELQFLVGGKVDKIYQENKNMLLQLHVPSKGKQMLNVISPKYFYLSSKRPDFANAGGFCMFLRKYLENTRIRSIKQAGFERIIEIEFESKEETYKMIIELFSVGNIILCKHDYMIMSAVETKTWSERTVRGGVKYEFPSKKYNILDISETNLKKAIDESEKESIVKSLAIDLGIGGVYAEEVCSLSEIDKSKKGLDEKEIKRLHKALNDIANKNIEAIVTEKNEAFPFILKNLKFEKRFETFNAAIDSIITPTIISTKKKEETSKHDKKIEKIKDIIKKQEKQVEALQKGFEENTRLGEMIYEQYSLVKEIMDTLKKAREKHSWKEIKEKLKNHKIIKEIDEKESKVTIEIDNK